MTYFLLIFTGLGVGLISTIFGVGGGVIAIPVLYELYPQVDPKIVISSSMGMIFINSIINTRNFIKKDIKVPLRTIKLMLPGILIGVLSGVHFATQVSPRSLKLIFATVTLLTCLRMLIITTNSSSSTDSPPCKIRTFSVCLLGGLVSGMTGLGGGAVMVPLFISVLNISLKKVSAYSNIAMGAATFFGVLKFSFTETTSQVASGLSILKVNAVDFNIILPLSLGALLISKSGVKIGSKLSPRVTKNLFITILFLISTRIFYQNW